MKYITYDIYETYLHTYICSYYHIYVYMHVHITVVSQAFDWIKLFSVLSWSLRSNCYRSAFPLEDCSKSRGRTPQTPLDRLSSYCKLIPPTFPMPLSAGLPDQRRMTPEYNVWQDIEELDRSSTGRWSHTVCNRFWPWYQASVNECSFRRRYGCSSLSGVWSEQMPSLHRSSGRAVRPKHHQEVRYSNRVWTGLMHVPDHDSNRTRATGGWIAVDEVGSSKCWWVQRSVHGMILPDRSKHRGCGPSSMERSSFQ